MADTGTSGQVLKVKAPHSDKWCTLPADGSDNTEQQRTRENLKETLLTSLQMQHIVVLAGLGTSVGSGGPSMQNLWKAAIGEPAGEPAAKVAEKLNYNPNAETANLEEFLSKCEAYLLVKEDADVADFVAACKKVILEKCSQFLDVEIQGGHDPLHAHEIFLHRLSRRRVRDPRLRVFTTNYDLCFERAASALGGVVIDGFSLTPPRHYDPRYFGYDIIRRPRPDEDQGNYLEGVFLLYKLHGSVNWARCTDGTIQEKLNPLPEEACLIYPASGKYHQSFLNPYLEAMSQYLAALREPNTCVIVIGFGLSDDHLSEPLLAAVRSNPNLRVIIVNPGIVDRENEGNKNRYWSEFLACAQDGEDVWLLNTSFQAFTNIIPDLKSVTPADRLMKTIQSVTRQE